MRRLTVGLLVMVAVAASSCTNRPVPSDDEVRQTNYGVPSLTEMDNPTHYVWFPGGSYSVFYRHQGEEEIWRSRFATGYTVEQLAPADEAQGTLRLTLVDAPASVKVEITEGGAAVGVLTRNHPDMVLQVPRGTQLMVKTFAPDGSHGARLRWEFTPHEVTELKVVSRGDGITALPTITLGSRYQWGAQYWDAEHVGGYLLRYAPFKPGDRGKEATFRVEGQVPELGWVVELVDPESLKVVVELRPDRRVVAHRIDTDQVLVKVHAAPGTNLSALRISMGR